MRTSYAHTEKSSWQLDLSALISGQLVPFSQAEEEIKQGVFGI